MKKFEKLACNIAAELRMLLNIQNTNPIGVILGTGWNDKLNLREMKSISFGHFNEFHSMEVLPGHERKFIHGFIGETEVVGLSGRIHLNERPGCFDNFIKTRLQVQVLLELGVKKLITTAAVGSLPGKSINVADIVIIDKLLTLFAPQMPLWSGEFVSPEDTLSPDLIRVAYADQLEYKIDSIKKGTHAMVLGPNFEGRKMDKKILANLGADVVGMSILPDCCIAALYNAKVLALGFVTNDSVQEHSHEDNMEKAREYSQKLSNYLSRVIQDI